MTPQEHPAICPMGHRIVPSTDEHWTIRELEPGLYKYVYGHCEDLPPAQEPETEPKEP